MTDETMDIQETAASEETVAEPVETAEMVAEQTAEVVAEQTQTSEPESGGSLMDYSDTFKSLTEGSVVKGTVVHIDREGVLVDVGTKSEGIIRPDELSAMPVQSAEDVVSVGDKIDVYVVQSENKDGNPVLSKKRADFEDAWDRVQEAYEQEKTLTAMVYDRVKGGLVVDLGIRGFVPGSHIGGGKMKNLDRYVGQSLPFKVIEVDRERRKVVLSHRLAVEEDQKKARKETVATLAEGQVRPGIVRRITDYGAFIDLGGIDGLLHVSEMSWTRINHPSDVVKVGQKLNVMVLKLNLEQGRVSLGLRQILPDPWSDVEQRFKVGETITGQISRIVPFGAFVQLGGGIEGIIPNAELSHKRVKKPDEVVSVGEQIEAKVVDVRPEERRLTLSIRQMTEDKERRDYESYRTTTRAESGGGGGMTLGDLFGDKLQGLVGTEESSAAEEAEEPAAEATAPVEPEAEAPAAEEPVAVEATVEEPAVEEPVVEEPVAEAAETAPEEAAEEKPEETA